LVLDPLLPQALWPADYVGAEVAARHQTFWRTMRQRWQEQTSEATTNLANGRL